jgi:hypothetical protein
MNQVKGHASPEIAGALTRASESVTNKSEGWQASLGRHVADLMHMSDRLGLRFTDVLDVALPHYRREKIDHEKPAGTDVCGDCEGMGCHACNYVGWRRL